MDDRADRRFGHALAANRGKFPGLDTITRELAERKITVPFLEGAVRTVLVNAGAITVGRGETAISFYTVRESLKKDCPYLCWC